MEKINKYKIITTEDGFIESFYSTLDDDYDFEGQMANYPEALEGWCKVENNKVVVDEVKKAEIIAKREEEAREAEKEAERPFAQIEYTALMTDTLLPETE